MRLYGKNPVIERIRSNPRSIRKLYLCEKTELSDVVKAAKAAGLDFESVARSRFDKICGDVHGQGVVAEVGDFQYVPFDDILDRAAENKTIPAFIDGVTDPQNLGSIIRSLACIGGFSIILPEHNSVLINETVLRVASGGENHVPVAAIPNCVKGVVAAKQRGLWIAGAIAENGEDIFTQEINFPLAVVIGSEGKGIRPGLAKQLDSRLSLPMRGAPLSYNVAVATALFCFEVSRRKCAKDR